MTETQLRTFSSCRERVYHEGLRPRWIHAANSAGTLDHPLAHFNLVRPGIALYGYDPQPGRDRGLKPVLALKSRISLVRSIPAGSRVGYGGTFTAARDIRLATVPIGYGDGYSRHWSNCGEVLCEGHRIPLVGRVSMDYITLDVTSLCGVSAGSQVTLLGKSGGDEINAAHMASRLNTIPYEILTSLSTRLSRAYLA
jgi:alanine racemase